MRPPRVGRKTRQLQVGKLLYDLTVNQAPAALAALAIRTYAILGPTIFAGLCGTAFGAILALLYANRHALFDWEISIRRKSAEEPPEPPNLPPAANDLEREDEDPPLLVG